MFSCANLYARPSPSSCHVSFFPFPPRAVFRRGLGKAAAHVDAPRGHVPPLRGERCPETGGDKHLRTDDSEVKNIPRGDYSSNSMTWPDALLVHRHYLLFPAKAPVCVCAGASTEPQHKSLLF